MDTSQTLEYLFDVKLLASLRIKAKSEAEARRLLATLLDVATVNFGEIDGEPMIGEASIDGEPDLVEVEPMVSTNDATQQCFPDGARRARVP